MLRVRGFTRNANVAPLNENQEGENRPFQYGPHPSGSVATPPLSCRPNDRLQPPPVTEGGGLSAGFPLAVAEGPEPGVLNLKAPA